MKVWAYLDSLEDACANPGALGVSAADYSSRLSRGRLACDVLPSRSGPEPSSWIGSEERLVSRPC